MVRFAETGWRKFPFDPVLTDWVEAVRPAALATLSDPIYSHWWRNEGTWFVGVNALANDAAGKLGQDAPQLAGNAVDFAHTLHSGPLHWDRAQISAVLPGYPQQGDDSDTAYAFRRNRDAAHLDGLKRVQGARVLDEAPAFLLGIPLTAADQGASPLVVWEGSHLIMARVLGAALRDVSPRDWRSVDLTEPYKRARRICFENCKRVALHATPGQAHVLHRLLLHGVCPWRKGSQAETPGRVVAYFRPELQDLALWPRV